LPSSEILSSQIMNIELEVGEVTGACRKGGVGADLGDKHR